jgi:hypothetical protein
MANILGGGGIFWNIVAASSYAIDAVQQAAILRQIQQQQADTAATESNGYRPSAWGNQALQTTLIVPGAQVINTGNATDLNAVNSSGAINQDTGLFQLQVNEGTTEPTPDTILIFDAVLRLEHEHEIRPTEHPVQNGANISDDAIILPAQVSLEIGMSDAMDVYTPGQWSDAPSKSVSCFQQLDALQKTRLPFTLVTRLFTYENVVLARISAPDDARTTTGLRASLHFRQIFVGTVTTTPVSSRPHTTNVTNIGTKPSLPMDTTLEAQHTPATPNLDVPNPGQLSSNPTLVEPVPNGS